MISNINNIEQNIFKTQISQWRVATSLIRASLNNFDIEDQAIISSQAELLNELDKFNSGEDNIVDLALASVMTEITVSAEVNVINTKNDMFKTILDSIK
jgi:hypothetical protein